MASRPKKPGRPKKASHSDEFWNRFVKLGTKFKRVDNSIHPVVEGVGYVEKREGSGSPYFTVYPGMKVNKTTPLMINVKLDEGHENPFKWHCKEPRYVHAFMEGIPRPAPEVTDISSYYFEDGHRKVKPYFLVHEDYFDHPPKVRTVGEYLNNALFDIPQEWIDFRIRNGFTDVNMEHVTSPDHPLKQGDFVTTLVHCHERPVLDEAIEIIHEDQEMLVVNKPSSMMIYPASGYRLNTILYILAAEKGYRNLRPIHRLDKLTSGVLILAKCNEVVGVPKLNAQFRNDARKEYLALVDGHFPSTPPEGLKMDLAIGSFQSKHMTEKTFSSGPKDCTTTFHLVSTFKDCSLVRCIPQQGRTHQIRIHLKAMGHPIVNDPLYNPLDMARWENSLNRVAREGMRRVMANQSNPPTRPISQAEDWRQRLSENLGNPTHYCHECVLGKEMDFWHVQDLKFICLHSWKYSVNERTFEAPWPKWASSATIRDQLLESRLAPPLKVPY